MGFNKIEELSKLDFNHPAYLCKIRAISPEDDEIFQELKLEYEKINQFSNSKQRFLCTLICSILIQERLYFAMSKMGLNKLMKQDVNLGNFNVGIDNNISWASILAWLYNDVKLLELVQQGPRRKPSVFRINKDSELGKKIYDYLLVKGINKVSQRTEAIEFISIKDEK